MKTASFVEVKIEQLHGERGEPDQITSNIHMTIGMSNEDKQEAIKRLKEAIEILKTRNQTPS